MMSRPTYPTNSFQQLGMALAGLLLAGSATSASTGQPELMCGDHDPQHNTCSSILQVTREGEQLQFVLYLLLPGSTDQEQPVKVVLQAAAQIYGDRVCMRIGDLARSLKVFAPFDRRPSTEDDLDLGEGEARRMLEASKVGRYDMRNDDEHCGPLSGLGEQGSEFIPQPQAAQLTLRLVD